jgi:hypothetical protein
LEELAQVRDVLAKCDMPLWSRSDAEVASGVEMGWACVQQALAATARFVREAEARGLPEKEAQSSTPVWLRQRLRASIREAKQLTLLGEALDRFPTLAAAITNGAVSAEQVRTIATSIAELPSDTDTETVAAAEAALLTHAAQFDPVILGRLGTRILAHVDPDAADRNDAEGLKRQEQRARQARGFTMSPRGDGLVRLSGWLDDAAAAIVNAAIDPLCHPARDSAGDTDIARTPAQRRADALVDICNRALRGGGDLPGSNGDPAQVVVTIPLDTLRSTPPAPRSDPPSTTSGIITTGGDPADSDTTGGDPAGSDTASSGLAGTDADTCVGADASTGLDMGAGAGVGVGLGAGVGLDAGVGLGADAGVGWLDTGALLSATEARLLACDARIIPAVLGTEGQVLDIGQARRLFTGPLRRAIVLRDGGCSFPGCDRPAAWCDAHHLIPWADGGPTALANGCLLCRHHHGVIHRTAWEVRLSADGRPEFLPPPTVDPLRRPQRNTFHRRQ